MSLMATRCLLGKRKTRSKNHEECLLDPEYDRSNGKAGEGRGKKLVKTIAAMFGFGRKKKGEEVERIGYEELEKDMPFQWVGFDQEEKEGKSEDLREQQGKKKKKRPRLEELLGWGMELGEKDDGM